jgi:hypothetical protein
MSKSNEMKTKQETGSQLQLFLWRLPKKNHDAMVQFAKQVNDLFRKHGMEPPEVFQLNNNNAKTSEDMGFTNMANAISANHLELHSYNGSKHQEEISAIMQNDGTAGQFLKQFTDLITSGSCIEGQFVRIRV